MAASFSGINHTLTLIDTSGAEQFDNLRKVLYRDSKLFVICFRRSSTDGVSNVLQKVRESNVMNKKR